jgi:hypothetical protein
LFSVEEAMEEPTLHELVVSYRASGEGKERIMERVAALVYSSHGKFGFDDEDDAAEALFKHRGRIVRLVDRFEDRGIPFDACLATSLRYLAKTVRRNRRLASDRELVCESAILSGSAQGEGAEMPYLFGFSEDEEPEGGSCAAPRPAPRRRPRARGGSVRCGAMERAAYSSRLVYLAIKCAWEIDEEGVARVADSAGVEREWLASAVEQARRSLESERSRVETLVQRRNASWCRQRLLESRMGVEADPYRRRRLEASLERERARCAKAKAELGNLRTIVPNSVVARILGVPKGTVDSGLYYLRRRYDLGATGRAPEGSGRDPG